MRSRVRPTYDVHAFKVKCNRGPLTIASGGNGYQGFSYDFRLSDFPNAAELGVLYDQYMIKYVKFYFVCPSNVTTVMEGINSVIGMPQITLVRDHDDATAPASSEAGLNSIREYSKSKSFTFSADRNVCKVGIKPAILSEVYRSGVSTTYSPKFRQWIDCTTTDVPHYGLKGVARLPLFTGTVPGSNGYDIDLFATYYVVCRGTR